MCAWKSLCPRLCRKKKEAKGCPYANRRHCRDACREGGGPDGDLGCCKAVTVHGCSDTACISWSYIDPQTLNYISLPSERGAFRTNRPLKLVLSACARHFPSSICKSRSCPPQTPNPRNPTKFRLWGPRPERSHQRPRDTSSQAHPSLSDGPESLRLDHRKDPRVAL